MHDLVYAGSEVERLISEKFPSVKIKDASDFIHTERFEVELDDSLKDDFYIFAMREGFALCCLGLQIQIRGVDKNDKEELWRWINAAKNGGRK